MEKIDFSKQWNNERVGAFTAVPDIACIILFYRLVLEDSWGMY